MNGPDSGRADALQAPRAPSFFLPGPGQGSRTKGKVMMWEVGGWASFQLIPTTESVSQESLAELDGTLFLGKCSGWPHRGERFQKDPFLSVILRHVHQGGGHLMLPVGPPLTPSVSPSPCSLWVRPPPCAPTPVPLLSLTIPPCPELTASSRCPLAPAAQASSAANAASLPCPTRPAVLRADHAGPPHGSLLPFATCSLHAGLPPSHPPSLGPGALGLLLSNETPAWFPTRTTACPFHILFLRPARLKSCAGQRASPCRMWPRASQSVRINSSYEASL